MGTGFPQGRAVTQYGLVDDFSWTRGKHSFRFGINFRRDDVSDHNFINVIPLAQDTSLNDFAFGGVAPSNTAVGNLVAQNFPSAAQLVNGLPNPCHSAANFAHPTNDFGTQIRNQFRGPGYFDTDFGVEKAFAIPKWKTAQFSIGTRFFNLFNHPNFAFPNTNADNGQFGQITQNVSQPTTIYGSGLGADASPRVIELQGKFVF